MGLPTVSGAGGLLPTRHDLRARGGAAAGGADLSGLIEGFASSVDAAQKTADRAIQDLAAGKDGEVHDVMLKAAKADIGFRLLLTICNKVLEGAQELWRMTV